MTATLSETRPRGPVWKRAKECGEDGCFRKIHARGLCDYHYRAAKEAKAAVPCSVDGCDRPVRARTWCTLHYSRWLKFGDPMEEVTAGDRTKFPAPAVPAPRTPKQRQDFKTLANRCSVAGCTEEAYHRTYCRSHYATWRRHGDAEATRDTWEDTQELPSELVYWLKARRARIEREDQQYRLLN
jgi:hypothetical protein